MYMKLYRYNIVHWIFLQIVLGKLATDLENVINENAPRSLIFHIIFINTFISCFIYLQCHLTLLL